MRKLILSTGWRGYYPPGVTNFLKIITVTFILIFASVLHVSAQDIPVSGRVTSADGEGMPGVTVVVKGTGTGTVTDSLGNYTISVPNSDAVLEFSYLGYKTQEVKVGEQSEMNIALAEDAQADEVVVIGYGTQKKKDVTGAVSSVKSEDLNRVVVVDATQAIQGRAPGITVTQNTGAPGAPLTVRVRGVGTINNSDPLYVVNGIPVGGIGDINSNDIESIEILKDASACAVYGARAANGVVLVTTKGGSPRKTTFELNVLGGVSREWKRYNLLNASQWATLRNEASMTDGSPILYADPNALGEGTDWQDEIFRKAYMQSYHLSASGGTERANYYFSGGYLNQEGILKNSNYKRYSFNARGDYKLAKRLKVGTFVNLAFVDRNQLYDGDPYNSVIATALSIDPITPVLSGRGGDSMFASGVPRTDVPNPMARLTFWNNNFRGVNFLGNWFGEYEFIKGLKFKSNLGVAYNSILNSEYHGKYFVSNSERLPESEVINQQDVNRLYVWENSLNYEKTIAEDHTVGGLLLFGVQSNRDEHFRVLKTNTPSNDPSQRYLNTASGSATASGDASEWSLVSYLMRVNYAYKGRYLITANVRRDGTSRFPVDNRWGNFPSVAAGWVISEEGFYEGLRGYANFLKLRASWGKLGNQNIPGGVYPYTTNIYGGYNYTFNNAMAPGSTPLGAGNPDIKWEAVTLSNIGLDFGFLNNRISLSVDYFIKKTSDMLIQKPLPGYTGVTDPPFVNEGEVVNKGLELFAEYNNQVGAFKYRVGGNFTTIKNEVTSLPDPIRQGLFRTQTTNITQQGSPIAQFYGYQTNGIVQTQEEANALQTIQPGVRPGDFKFVDRDGDGDLDEDDRTILGSPLPKFTYGLTGSVEFKGFDLNFLLQGSHGNQIFNGSKFTLEGGVIYNNLSQTMLDRWTGPGSTNEIPRVSLNDPNNNRRVSDYYVENGGFLRIRTVQLGYTLPQSISEVVRLQKVRVFIMAQNLYTFTKYTGLDPEIGTYTPAFNTTQSYLDVGVDKGGTYPQARTWFLGLNVSF